MNLDPTWFVVLILADNDILFTLGACNLLHELPGLFGITPEEVVILPWTQHYLRRSIEKEVFRSQYSYEGIERAIAFADSVSLLDASLVDEQVYGALVGLPRMDIGEATLLSALPNLDEGYLVTGDKACLQSLAEADQCEPLVDVVRERVVCLDQIVLLAIQELGYVRVRTCLRSKVESAFDAGFVQIKAFFVFDAPHRAQKGTQIGTTLARNAPRK